MIPTTKETSFNSYKEEAIYRNNVGCNLDYKIAREAFREILVIRDGGKRYAYMGMLLNGVIHNNPQPSTIKALLDSAFELDHYDINNKYILTNNERKGRHIITLAGSGKKGFKTFNITSAAAFTAACTEVLIAKPCSSSTSSVTGSSDFVTLLGANINIPFDEMLGVMVKNGIGFFSIEKTIPKFDKTYGGKFFAPHALSFGLAGLLHPIKTDHLIYGIAHPNLTLALNVFKLYGLPNTLALTSTPDGVHYVDDLLPFGSSIIQGYRNGDEVGRYKLLDIKNILDLPNYSPDEIRQRDTKDENLLLTLKALAGYGSEAVIDTIAINAATILYMTNVCSDMVCGFSRAKEFIKSGEVLEKIRSFITDTNGNISKFDHYLKSIK